MIYKLYKTVGSDVANAAMTINIEPAKSFIFDPSNTDYQTFKKDINEGAELLDAEGNVMTDAQAFVKELP